LDLLAAFHLVGASSIVGSVVVARLSGADVTGLALALTEEPGSFTAARFLAGFVDCRVGSRPRHRGWQASRRSGS
jgi:hypothetical protein